MKINLLDYKGKHYIYQDAGIELDFMDFVIGETTKEAILKDKGEIKAHKEAAEYYGIPAYLGNDPELREVFK